jgi:DNA-binding response OmpR family regulator
MAPLRGRRVLLVEDEDLVAALVEDALREAGAAVLGPAATVAGALALLAASPERPDAAVLDVNLGGESCAAVADALAAQGVPFLLASGYGAPDLPPSHAGAPLLAKPFDTETLIAAVAALGRITPG